MEEINNAFSSYVEEFKKLDTIGKRNEILNSIKEMIAIFDELGRIDNINLEHLHNNIPDVNDVEDDFLVSELIYLEDAKNLVGQYLDKKN